MGSSIVHDDPEEEAAWQKRKASFSYWFEGVRRRARHLWSDFLHRYIIRIWSVDCRHDFGPNTRYRGDYCDPCGLMLYAPFAILVTFVEEEMFQSFVDWDSEECGMRERRDEILALYQWWTNDRNHRWEQLYKELEAIDAAEGPAMRFGKVDPKTSTGRIHLAKSERRDRAHARWTELDNQDDEMLLRLIKIRGMLWT